MAVFAYKGRNLRGDLVEGTLDGDDSGVIADQLMNTGITPVEVKPFRSIRGGISSKPGWLRNLFKEKQVTQIDLMLFSRQMYTLLKAGVPIMRALAGLQESTQNPVFCGDASGLARKPGQRTRTQLRDAPPSQGFFPVLCQHGAGR